MSEAGDGLGTIQELRSVSMLDYFDQELHPIFCLDVHDDNSDKPLKPVFQNTFLRVSGLWTKLVPHSTPILPADHPSFDFISWARESTDAELESSRFLKHQDIHWTKTILLDRWRVITGSFCSNPASSTLLRAESAKLQESLQDAHHDLLRGVVDQGYRELSKQDNGHNSEADFSVDRGHIQANTAPMNLKWGGHELEKPSGYPQPTPSQEWLNCFDWEMTEIDHPDTWDPQLKRLGQLIMADPLPAAAYWGPRKLILYNEHYRWLLGDKHPEAMGKSFGEVWPEIEEVFGAIFDKAAAEKAAVTSEDTEFHIQRYGNIEQTYFSWSIIPICDDSGHVAGYYNPSRETTGQKTLYRRMSLLLSLSQSLSAAGAVTDFWSHIVNALDDATNDVPFLLVYGAEDVDSSDAAMFQKTQGDVRRWELKGTLGYPKDLDQLPHVIDFDDTDSDMKAFVAKIRHSRDSLLMSTTDGSFPARMMTTIHTRSFGERCSQAIYCPIRPYMSASVSAVGFVILGVNPRRTYDGDYKLFIQLLMRQMASSMAAVLLFADTVRRSEQKASSLRRQLATQTKLAEDSEARFQNMADQAPVAMFKLRPDGILDYGNDDFFEITESNPADTRPFVYRESVDDEYQEVATRQWNRLSKDLAPVNDEIRLKKSWTSPDGTVSSTWVVAAAYPELDLKGELVGVLGCLTDISRQKWAEQIQARRMEEAIELKRQQEMFIDMTSHELRNPLSAIVQCADGIIASFDKPEPPSAKEMTLSASEITAVIDAAQTILFCAQHQKRISDDVLVLSKLNSDLVIITPVDVKPAEVILSGLRVFDRELKSSRIQLSMHAERSYSELNIESVRLDPSRMLQVLINLVTNAIKFTEPERRRQIDVRFGASLTEDFTELQGFQFWNKDTRALGADILDSQVDWGEGEVVYLFMSVKDTGRGLREDEMEFLFQRFSQASPRTHIQYGGSGLGLFISKRLSEAQGGAIGAKSVHSQGSTFAFYVKARRSPPSVVPEPVAAIPVADTIIIGENRQIRVNIPVGKDRPSLGRWGGEGGSQVKSPSSSSFLSPVSNSSRSGSGEKTSQLPRATGHNEALHVLIVEDNLVNQKVLAKQLQRAGYVVAIANHGVEALEHLQRTEFWKATEESIISENPSTQPKLLRRTSSLRSVESDHLGLSRTSSISRPTSVASSAGISPGTENGARLRLDVVLMDLEMPIMDGITCVKRIRELQGQGKLGRVPVIAVTANARQEQINAAKEAGMDNVVCKPFRIPQLEKEIEATLKRTVTEKEG